MKSFLSGWYLIYTRPRHEKKVNARLTELDILTFLPLTKKLRQWHDRKKYVDEALFASYVFVYLSDMQAYYHAMDTEGFLYYVKAGKEISRVQDSVVNALQLVCSQNQDLQISEARFQRGNKMMISQGALTGLMCEIVEVSDKQMILVRVDLLQRNVLITLPVESIA